jgi:hypothetical protein
MMNLLVRRNLPFQVFNRRRWRGDRPAVLVMVGQPELFATDKEVDSWRSAGTSILEGRSARDPSAKAAEVRRILGDGRPFRLANAQQVIGFLTTGRERVLRLLNYSIDPIQDLRVQLRKIPRRATLYSPDEPDGKSCEIRQGEVAIPEMGVYRTILLE